MKLTAPCIFGPVHQDQRVNQSQPKEASVCSEALRCCCNCTPPKDVARASEIQALCHRTTVLHYPSILYTYYTILEYTCMHLNISLLFSVTPLSLSVTPL